MRHGHSEANLAKQFGHVGGAKLTELGISQAEEAAKRFKNIHFDKAISSDFVRAKQTAEIVAKEHDLIVETEKTLRERSYGRLNGKNQEEMRRELGELYDAYLKLSEKDKFTKKLVDDMETTEEAYQRFNLYLREAALAYQGMTVLIVCHVTLMRGFLIKLGYADYEQITSNNIINAAYFIVECDGVEFFLKKVEGVTIQK